MHELVQLPWHLCTSSYKGPGTFVRARTEVQAPLYELVQGSWRLCTSSYKGPGTFVRARTK
eukprot:2043905-Alexandrium_andersonii.AAC.1